MALPSVGGAYIKGKGNTLHNVREGLCTKANMRECVHSRNITLEVLTFLVSELFRFHCYNVNVFECLLVITDRVDLIDVFSL